MSSTIEFLREPRYTDTVLLFVLTPAGVRYDASDIGSNLFGSDDWTDEHLCIDGLSRKPAFRYTDISVHWTDFLDLAFHHADHALFYVPHKRTFKEIRKELLLDQNPDLFTFSFHKFFCAARTGMTLPPAPAPEPLRRVIHPPKTPPASTTVPPAAPVATKLVDARYVSVDAEKLSLVVTQLSALFTTSLDELREIRSLLERS